MSISEQTKPHGTDTRIEWICRNCGHLNESDTNWSAPAMTDKGHPGAVVQCRGCGKLFIAEQPRP